MTVFERNQNRIAFFNAGSTAWHMQIDAANNPYLEEPARGQWERGWRNEQRKFNERFVRKPFKRGFKNVQRNERTGYKK